MNTTIQNSRCSYTETNKMS